MKPVVPSFLPTFAVLTLLAIVTTAAVPRLCAEEPAARKTTTHRHRTTSNSTKKRTHQKRDEGVVGTFKHVGGNLEKFFTGKRTVDRDVK